jgi:hypothetical protein
MTVSDPLRVRDLAEKLGISPKTMRAWMRTQGWRSLVEHGQPWLLTPEQAELLREHFSGDAEDDSAVVSGMGPADPLPELSVAELLGTYRRVLASLRARGMVRTHNAPIGDLAEYCAAIVYDGLLAPNSEKSYDLVAEDGRRIQVKARLLRPGTSRAAVFSPIRSFDFDACLFLLINDEIDEIDTARELTVEQVREIGQHRAHTNGTVLTIGKVRGVLAGIDRTDEFRAAWRELLGRIG